MKRRSLVLALLFLGCTGCRHSYRWQMEPSPTPGWVETTYYVNNHPCAKLVRTDANQWIALVRRQTVWTTYAEAWKYIEDVCR